LKTKKERLLHRQGKNIMILDNCGKVLKSSIVNASDLDDSDSVLPKLDYVDYKSPKFDLEFKKQSRRDERENGDQYTIESLSQVYQYVDKKLNLDTSNNL
jgi:hypothetical protein